MSDMRFILMGVALIFAGFVVLGVLGGQYSGAFVESSEFGTCYEYASEGTYVQAPREDALWPPWEEVRTEIPPQEVDCADKIRNEVLFLSLVIGIIGAGVIALVKGTRGDWDSRVRPEDMVGPGRRENPDDPK